MIVNQYTQEQLNYIALEAKKELARRNYIDYVEYVHRGMWKAFPVHQLICQKLEDVFIGKIKRLIIEMPPRHGKSNTVTESFPSYYMSKYAKMGIRKNVIQVSYSGDLAEDFGGKNLSKVKEYGNELFGVELAQQTKKKWSLKNGATMTSAGVGGPLTGKGADLLIIDDPIKNREEAESETIREKIWSEWTSTLRTRLHKGASVIVIQTRWHEDDLAGRLQKQGGWEVLSLPAICDIPDDPLGRSYGEPLCPGLGFDEAWAELTKREVGSRAWESLYQQRPTAAEGNIIKRDWIKYYDNSTKPETFDEVIQSWDCAFKDTDGSDFVAGLVFGRKGPDHYLLYRFKDRIDFVGTMRQIQHVSKLFPQAYLKLIEDKANGTAVINMLRQKVPGILAVTPRESKESRTRAVTPIMEAGNFYVPRDAEWTDDYINELVSFPNGAHDDQVDATSQYLSRHINPSRVVNVDTTRYNDDDWLFY